MDDLHLRRKLTLKARGKRIVLVKKPVESMEHVLMKAFLWALYLERYPTLSVEVSIGQRYKPDVVQVDASGRPTFWGEAGKVGRSKLATVLRRFPDTHFAIAKWSEPLRPHEEMILDILKTVPRSAPVDLWSFPSDSASFVTDDGSVGIERAKVRHIRMGSSRSF